MKTIGIFSLFLILALAFSSNAASLPKNVKINKVVMVDPKPGKANFTTIGAAINSCPSFSSNSSGYCVVLIARGTYDELVTVTYDKMFVMLIGAGIGKTIITGSKSAGDSGGTYFSATFAISAPNFVAEKITFRNTAGAAKNQAVAVRNEGDMSAFYMCSFEGYQATLYAFSGKQFYKKCDIYGTVDAIFGNAAAIFQQSNIYARAPLPGQYNTITANNSGAVNQPTGFVFQKCNVAPAPGLQGPVKEFLGSPWGAFARTVFIESVLGSLIDPAGWEAWPGTDSSSTVYYAEYKNTGPGASTAGRIKWPGYHILISPADVTPFAVENFINGKQWLPSTGVPTTYGVK